MKHVEPLPLTAQQIADIQETVRILRERERLERKLAQQIVDVLMSTIEHSSFQMRHQRLPI